MKTGKYRFRNERIEEIRSVGGKMQKVMLWIGRYRFGCERIEETWHVSGRNLIDWK